MKKSLLLGIFLAVTLFLSPAVFAQDIDCDTCSDKTCRALPTIPCTTSVQGEGCYQEPLNNWECFIFPVCDCPDTIKEFKGGSKIGVRMHILTKGVYWADDVNDLTFYAYKSFEDACKKSSSKRMKGEFSDILYFKDQTCDPEKAMYPEPHSLCTWKDDDKNDTDSDHPKLKSLSTNSDNEDAFFTIPNDSTWDGYSFWSVQIPPIRIDTEEILRGESVRIRIEFIKPGTGGICQGACQVLCECTIEVATLCLSDEGCIYFPYVVSQLPPWATGIALTNLSDIPSEDMVATFYLTDANGDTFEYTKTDFASTNWSNVLDNMLGEFDGDPLKGQAWLRIRTNFEVDGYSFITDGSFGGSTLARECNWPYWYGYPIK